MKIRITDVISAGAPFVTPILVRKLDALPKDPRGSHVLMAAGVAVRITIHIGEYVGDPPNGARIELHALDAASAFPIFHGTLSVEPVDTFSCRLVLEGQYSVPLGAIGAIADRTLLAGTAKRSLRVLLSDIRAEVAASVARSVTGV